MTDMTNSGDNVKPKDTKSLTWDELEQALRDMQPRQKLYELVKAEMQRRGRWKGKPRGKPTPENLK